jgi:serine/threonine-protein kinase
MLGPDSSVTGLPFIKLMEAQARLAVGRETAAWDIWADAISEIRASDDQAWPISQRWFAARLAAQYGRPEEAFALLDEAVARPSSETWSAPDLELDPRWDSVRDDPRFDALIARQRAYEDEQARLAEAEGPWLP